MDDPYKHVIPATPGFFVLSKYEDTDGSWQVARNPVIAWGISEWCSEYGSKDYFYNAWPISIDSGQDDVWKTALLCPDGRVMVQDDVAWDSVDEYIASLNKPRP